ncbi:glycosyltransferase [Flagellimonas sp. CMM7]|uniref:glycosyltransferase n=1 Tax=Flagellimonas sp. CMM7 TaxID=2654676 RepID=UPI0013D1F246|nr:glycosyltransferase [Flagellimonas sp. CMM7]UII79914.1 glycosyltransferase [Flagellimonas sp. CMM7]
MRILIIIPNNNLGGAEQFLRMVASHYSQEHDVTVYFFYKKVEINAWDSLKGSNVKKLLFSDKSEKIGFVKFLLHQVFQNKKKYDYIYTSNVFVTGITGLLLKIRLLSCKKFIGRESTSIFIRYKGSKLKRYKFFYHLGYSKVNLLICQTDTMRKQLVSALPFLKPKAKTISNPINLHEIRSMSEEQLNRSLPSKFIISAGRLKPIKGYDYLIKAFASIKTDFPELKLVILGDGDLKDTLQNICESLDLKDDVIFEGYVQNVYPYFKKAELCVVSSILEGFPNVLLQMMSQNDKVVSTLCAGNIDEIKGIETCIPGDEILLARAMEKMLTQDTGSNRILFDTFLASNDIAKFVDKIEGLV